MIEIYSNYVCGNNISPKRKPAIPYETVGFHI